MRGSSNYCGRCWQEIHLSKTLSYLEAFAQERFVRSHGSSEECFNANAKIGLTIENDLRYPVGDQWR